MICIIDYGSPEREYATQIKQGKVMQNRYIDAHIYSKHGILLLTFVIENSNTAFNDILNNELNSMY